MPALKTIFCALVAGAIAITINILLLNFCDALGIVTARGGLQRLVRLWLGGPLAEIGISDLWTAAGLPGPDTSIFKSGFKVTVGLGMAIFYAFALVPLIHAEPMFRGLAYALFAWLLNAFLVLPLLGEGIAGARVLTSLGMLCFAIAHTVFFVLVAYLYAAFQGTWRV